MSKRIFILALVILLFDSCHVARFFFYNFSDVRDYKKFPSKPLKKPAESFHFVETGGTIKPRLPKLIIRKKEYNFSEGLKKSNTIAFLVIRNDSILYEWARPGYDSAAIVPSFSMAKSFVSAMIGIAMAEGKIQNTGEPITKYLDFLDPEKFSRITIQHLLDMQAGLKYNESYYNPFGEVARYYYGLHLNRYVRRLKVESAPGEPFDYKSVNTQLLAMILQKATGKSPAEYLQEKIWTPLGMEFDASWSVDSKKSQTEKAFCCINARARDFAKFGRLYLNKGEWNGKQIVPADWVDASVTFSTKKNEFLYSNQWWHTRTYYPISDTSTINGMYGVQMKKKPYYAYAPSGDFFAQGHLGQFIYVYPKKNIIIVRLGKNEKHMYWPGLMKQLAQVN